MDSLLNGGLRRIHSVDYDQRTRSSSGPAAARQVGQIETRIVKNMRMVIISCDKLDMVCGGSPIKGASVKDMEKLSRPRIYCLELRLVSLDREESYARERFSSRCELSLRAFRRRVFEACTSGAVNDMDNAVLFIDRSVGSQRLCPEIDMCMPVDYELAVMLIEGFDPRHTGLGIAFLVG